MTTTNPSVDYFEQVADQWDELRSGYFTEAVRDSAIRKAYLHPEMLAADVGAGTGSGPARQTRPGAGWLRCDAGGRA